MVKTFSIVKWEPFPLLTSERLFSLRENESGIDYTNRCCLICVNKYVGGSLPRLICGELSFLERARYRSIWFKLFVIWKIGSLLLRFKHK